MKSFKKFLKYFGVYSLSAGAGIGVGFALTDGVNAYHKNKSTGLELLVDGAHLKQGNHRVVITDQFYDMLTYETTELDQGIAINGIKKAYENLSELNSKLNFELCTTAEGLEKYDITKIDEVKNDDIPLYITNDAIENNQKVLAVTDWGIKYFTREIKDVSITFRKDSLFAVWNMGQSMQELLDPLNSVAYTITAHETMHAMGFAHQDTKDTIIYPYLSLDTPRDFTEKDKKMIDKYNVVFYNAESKYENSQEIISENTAELDM